MRTGSGYIPDPEPGNELQIPYKNGMPPPGQGLGIPFLVAPAASIIAAGPAHARCPILSVKRGGTCESADITGVHRFSCSSYPCQADPHSFIVPVREILKRPCARFRNSCIPPRNQKKAPSISQSSSAACWCREHSYRTGHRGQRCLPVRRLHPSRVRLPSNGPACHT